MRLALFLAKPDEGLCGACFQDGRSTSGRLFPRAAQAAVRFALYCDPLVFLPGCDFHRVTFEVINSRPFARLAFPHIETTENQEL
jgi:hypothetical protein